MFCGLYVVYRFVFCAIISSEFPINTGTKILPAAAPEMLSPSFPIDNETLTTGYPQWNAVRPRTGIEFEIIGENASLCTFIQIYLS